MSKKFFSYLLPFLFSLNLSAIEVHGHRGARAVLPENTLPAFEYAIKVGVDVLEFDLAVTKDNILVVSHDPFLNNTICNFKFKNHTPIRSLTLKEIKTIDCGTKKNPRFKNQKPYPGAKVPTLAEVFDFVQKSKLENAKKVSFNIETKIFPFHPNSTPSAQVFASLVVSTVEKYKLEKRTIIQSFDYRTIEYIKSLNPKIKTAFLNYASLPPFELFAKKLKVDYISPNLEWITKGQIQKLHKIGIKVVPWTANTKEQWEYLVSLGVDGIISDDPKTLIEYLKKRGLRK